MENDPEEERQTNRESGIFKSVQSLEVSWLVDGDVSVDCHEDDDVHRAGHEGVNERQLEMSLEEGGGVVASSKTRGDVIQSRNCGEEDAEVGDCQA